MRHRLLTADDDYAEDTILEDEAAEGEGVTTTRTLGRIHCRACKQPFDDEEDLFCQNCGEKRVISSKRITLTSGAGAPLAQSRSTRSELQTAPRQSAHIDDGVIDDDDAEQMQAPSDDEVGDAEAPEPSGSEYHDDDGVLDDDGIMHDEEGIVNEGIVDDPNQFLDDNDEDTF